MTLTHKNCTIEAEFNTALNLIYTVRFGGSIVIDSAQTISTGTAAISEIKKAVEDFIITLPPALSYKN